MYQVIAQNGNLQYMIHNYLTTEAKNRIESAQIVNGINEIDSFTFTIYPNNDGYNVLNPFSTSVSVWNAQKSRYDFIGRVLMVNPQMDSSGIVYKTVTCEGRLAYLRDSMQDYVDLTLYEAEQGNSGIQKFLAVLLTRHNSQMSVDKQIQIGSITIAPNDNVYCAIHYTDTMSVIQDCLIDKYGGEIRLRESSGVLYLDYAETFGTTRATKIELARNMQSARREIDPTAIITRLIPLGCKQTVTTSETDADGNITETVEETEHRLTIESVNDGVPYIIDSTAEALFGIIYGYQTWDDVTLPQNLKNKGIAWLAAHNTIPVTHDITAVDLSTIGLDIDDFVCGDSYPVKNVLIGLDATLRIIRKTTKINEPHMSALELGDNTLLLSDYIMGDGNSITNIADVLSQTQSGVTNIGNNLQVNVERTASSLIKQSEREIRAEVESTTVSKTLYQEFSETVKNILQMDAQGTTMLFQTINEAIETVNNRENSHYSEILKYIRFEDGNIILGERGNPLTLKIQNNRISFSQNGVEVAYFSNNKLYVTDGEFVTTLKIGKFQAAPRSNGNVSWSFIDA